MKSILCRPCYIEKIFSERLHILHCMFYIFYIHNTAQPFIPHCLFEFPKPEDGQNLITSRAVINEKRNWLWPFEPFAFSILTPEYLCGTKTLKSLKCKESWVIGEMHRYKRSSLFPSLIWVNYKWYVGVYTSLKQQHWLNQWVWDGIWPTAKGLG